MKFSTLLVGISLVSAIALPAKAEENNLQQTFYSRLVAALQSEPHLKGDEYALTVFAGMNDAQKLNLYHLGETFCAARQAGVSSKAIQRHVSETINADDTIAIDNKEPLYALETSAVIAATRTICPGLDD